MNRFFLSCALILVGVLVVIFGNPFSKANPELASGDPSAEIPSEEQGAPDIAKASAAPARSSAESSPDGVAPTGRVGAEGKGRPVLVLRPDGSPGQNMQVFFSMAPEEFAEDPGFVPLLADSGLIRPSSFSLNSPGVWTDGDGLAWLPKSGVGFAVVTEEGLEGGVAFGVWDGDSSNPVRLELRKAIQFPVIALDAAGQPLPGQSIMVFHGQKDRLERAQDRSQGFYFPSPLGAARTTNDEGRAWMSSVVPEERISELGLRDAGTMIWVQISLPLGEKTTAPITLNQTQEIRLTMPPTGEARVVLNGYPDDIVPRLREDVDPRFGFRSSFSNAIPEEMPNEEGQWVFRHLPLGKKLKVELQRRSITERGGYSISSTSFEPHRMDGPGVEGEVVFGTFSQQVAGTFIGRLVGSQGNPLVPPTDRAWQITLLGRTADPAAASLRLPLDLTADGRFVARLPTQNAEDLRLHDLTELLFTRNLRLGTVGQSSDLLPDWARVELALSSTTLQADLGEVQLAREDPVLRVQVQDELGQAITGAMVSIERQITSPYGPVKTRWQSTRLPAHPSYRVVKTLEDGSVGFPGFDFTRTFPLYGGIGEATGRCQVKARHPDFLPVVHEFDSSERTLTLSLKPASIIRGRAELPDFLRDISVMALLPEGSQKQPGVVAPARKQLHGSSPTAEQVEQGTLVSFELGPVEPRLHDLLFYFSGSDREVLRVLGVDPSDPSGAETVVDLAPYLDHLELQVLSPTGEVWSKEDFRNRTLVLTENALEGNGRSGTGILWRDGYAYAAMPRGQKFQGFLACEGYRPIFLSDLDPGRHTVQLHPIVKVRFRFVHQVELPAGATLSLQLHSLASRRSPQALETESGCDLVLEMGEAGRYRLTWFLRGADQSLINMELSETTLDDSILDSSQIHDLPVPESLFKTR